ncbi:hypothetical protein DPEC_G00342440 [Dallia pectoralis]|uniref:Uncharacterized protein n=1 Tax=Dallia pectoralis TaxID=75939 RepID=A0ACC2F5P7_DALPE|nr:hypothetical protein DPEC_G00342440 [Dallia pectoralis]
MFDLPVIANSPESVVKALQSSGLPAGLLVSPALVRVVRGTAYIPVVNVGTIDVLLYPRTVVGTLNKVCVVSLPTGVTEVPSGVATVASQIVAPTVQDQIGVMDLSALSAEEQGLVKSLLGRYNSVFSAHDGDLGCTNLISHDIPLLDDVPVRQRYRRIPPSDYELVKGHIHQLLEAQVIRESSSPYASPIVLVKKKDGTLRMCVDYRQLNCKTRKDAFPLPRIEESLDVLTGARWFSTLDLASGYNQKEVRYLGHVISNEGVGTDPSKVEVVANWQSPATVSELQSFLGFDSYYRRFVEGFVKLAAPLHKLVAHLGATKSKRKAERAVIVNWTEECHSSFEALKARLRCLHMPTFHFHSFWRWTQVMVALVQCYHKSNMQADPVNQEVLVFWRREQRPDFDERRTSTRPALVLLRQWDRLVERSGVLYRQVFRPDGVEVALQVVVPASL